MYAMRPLGVGVGVVDFRFTTVVHLNAVSGHLNEAESPYLFDTSHWVDHIQSILFSLDKAF